MSTTASKEEEEDDCKLEFNLFGDFLDDIEHENVGIPKKSADKREIEKLLKFIGGFEYWSRLNEDCKMEVVKHLDYPSRCKLGICSKDDYKVVQKTPIYVYSVEMEDGEKYHYSFSDEAFDNVLVKVQFHRDYNSGKRFELIFSQLEDDTEIRWLRYYPKKRPEKRSFIWKPSSNYYEEAVKFAEGWMKKCNYELEHLTVEMSKYPKETSQIKFLPRCKSIRIAADDVEMFTWWFERIPEQLIDLQLLTQFENRDVFTIPSEFLNVPQVMLTPKFYFWCRAAFNNEQLLKLKSKSISFDSVNITEEGINQYIKNWVHGKGVDDFKQALIWCDKEWNQSLLTRGLEVRQWDEIFEDEAGGFCGDFERVCGRGTCFQISSRINPYESLTLSICGDRVAIYGTGKKTTWNGQIYTYYSIPM